MNRSIVIALSFGLGLVATPALAQQPLQPAPASPPAQGYAGPTPLQYDNGLQAPQPVDPSAQYGEDDDDEDDGMDVTYDISTDPQDQQYDDGYDANAYQQFESQLSPYGTWEDVPSYGHVWVPSPEEVGNDFQPYDTDGHWVDSDYGWAWDSDYNWGWAPFHYGRWMIMNGYGWCWQPGTTWGPAWVNWRWGGGYAGWAPMGPRGVVIGAPHGVRSPWRFTVANQLGALHPHYLPSRAVGSVWASTQALHNVSTINLHGTQVRFNAGPSSRMVQAATGRALTPVALRTAAPRAMPNQAITPRVGMPLAQRPWVQQPRSLGGAAFARHTLGSQPIYSRPGTTTIRARPQPLSYRAPTSTAYRSYGYTQPYRGNGSLTVYRSGAPVYGAPAQSYHPSSQLSLWRADAVVPSGASVSLRRVRRGDAVVPVAAVVSLRRAGAVVPPGRVADVPLGRVAVVPRRARAVVPLVGRRFLGRVPRRWRRRLSRRRRPSLRRSGSDPTRPCCSLSDRTPEPLHGQAAGTKGRAGADPRRR